MAPTTPKFIDALAVRENPLSFLNRAHAKCGDLAIISEDQPIFSRAQQSSGAVAAFGPRAVRQVLTDANLFGMPVSAANRYNLPRQIARLTAGLFAMRGDQHRLQQQFLISMLRAGSISSLRSAIARGWIAFVNELETSKDVPLLTQMRRLTRNISEYVIFGDTEIHAGELIQSYFDLRRDFSAACGADTTVRNRLVDTGTQLDDLLHTKLFELRKNSSPTSESGECLFSRLAELQSQATRLLSDDEVVAHTIVLFMSSSEPVAAALSWVLLLLSQTPSLCRALRDEINAACVGDDVPEDLSEIRLPLLRGVILESLRLLPPNAIMVRLTTGPGKIMAYEIPAHCEVILSPYVAHRDADEYSEPHVFDPCRWNALRPNAYSYLPFGAGTRYCLGKQLAIFILTSILVRLLSRFDVILSSDQVIDWKIDIILRPALDPIARFIPRGSSVSHYVGGRFEGPVLDLLRGFQS